MVIAGFEWFSSALTRCNGVPARSRFVAVE
jgi:hypothetical protein